MTDSGKLRLRVIRFLSRGSATILDATTKHVALLDDGKGATIAVPKRLLAAMVQTGLLTIDEGRIAVAAPGQGQAANHRELDLRCFEHGTERSWATVNLSESPLAQLVRRKSKSGEPFLSPAEFEAGERLRQDYTRGGIMPRLGANWEASVSSGRRHDGSAELADAALAARLRVERACRDVGPELSGLLIDVCCFLKGMETVELERGWPARSAKIMLKSALGMLHRHYHPGSAGRERKVVHWGAEDYRPSIR